MEGRAESMPWVVSSAAHRNWVHQRFAVLLGPCVVTVTGYSAVAFGQSLVGSAAGGAGARLTVDG